MLSKQLYKAIFSVVSPGLSKGHRNTIAILLFLLSSLKGISQTYCTSQTLAYCCGYGIVNVTMPGVSQSSQDASVGYEDFTAVISQNTEGTNIPIAIQTGGIEPHDVRVWLDADNDGTFSHPSEMVFEALGANSPSGNLALPANISFNTDLRLRITADLAGSTPLPCTNPTLGQTEDYLFRLIPAGELPVANFSAAATHTCNGATHFQNLSTGNPSAYFWSFGDGQSSSLPDPHHTYLMNGVYDVSLTVSNSQGSNTLLKANYIHVTLHETCDTFQVPAQGTSSILYGCNYVLTDNGRTGNYTDNTNGILSISPAFAQKVCIRFSEFHFEQVFDYLEIFDGPSPAFPLVGKYSGTGLPPDICSTGPSLCIRQVSDDIVNYPGFTAQVLCTMDMEEPQDMFASVYPNPFDVHFNVSFPYDMQEWNLEMYSITGRLVFTERYDTNSAVVFPGNLADGIYILRVKSGKDISQHKIIKGR